MTKVKRKSMTVGRKVEAHAQHGVCPMCKEPYPDGKVEYHHEPPLELQESEDDCRIIPLCPSCHAEETVRWRPFIDKARRLSDGRGSQYARRKRRGGSRIKGRKNPWPEGRRLPSRPLRKPTANKDGER